MKTHWLRLTSVLSKIGLWLNSPLKRGIYIAPYYLCLQFLETYEQIICRQISPSVNRIGYSEKRTIQFGLKISQATRTWTSCGLVALYISILEPNIRHIIVQIMFIKMFPALTLCLCHAPCSKSWFNDVDIWSDSASNEYCISLSAS